jgi:hypothetical protein
MRKHLVGALVLATVAVAASAAPAFTADNGTVTVTVTAQAPAAPCLTVSPGSVNFGTLPFSANNGAGLVSGDSDITITNCGTVGQNLYGATTDATGPSGAWSPTGHDDLTGTIAPCPDTNHFYLSIFGFTTPAMYMTGTPTPVHASLGGPNAVFPVGDKVFRLSIVMPCQGSNGAGETKSLSTTFTAVVA